ncbi:prenyltransferase/squalene oxidase repeat-containing protein [Streptomyces sp. NPDC091281]|uniref:prenyltransferase/squalene oxidase repeat-containing protein n=1 Tax=Streptomyces sp. NPDC091281 TaxID=3365985 RepID=UPI00382D95B8
MNVHRSAAVPSATAVIGAVALTTVTALTAVTALTGLASPAAAAPTPTPTPSVALPSGLYGTADPTYDGVWRQSLALLAQDTVGVVPAAKAVDWLTGQQCADGSFGAFRADPAAPCDPKLMVDSNSTAAAVQALAALGGQDAVADKAVTWLKSVQNADGGWGYSPGTPSDTNSTALVIGALAAAGEKPADVTRSAEAGKPGKSPYDALLTLATPCADGGAFAYQPDKKGKLTANADATAAGVVGALGAGLAPKPGENASAPVCTDSGPATPEQAAVNGAAYLAKAVAKDGHLTSVLPGSENQPDYGNTADAVVALAAQGGPEQAAKPLAWLEKNAGGWADQGGPAAYAQLVFAAHATGTDPRAFGGLDLVTSLNATGPAPRSTGGTDQADGSGSAKGEQGDTKGDEKKDDGDDGGFGVWWTVGVFLVAGIGIGFLISGRRKQQ